jgi:4-hydroxybenzoate polyprenyltransferase
MELRRIKPAPQKNRFWSGLWAELQQLATDYAVLMRLNRPIGIWLLLWPTLSALWIAGKGSPDPYVFTVFVVGVIVMRSAGCVINDYADRNLDGTVKRTANRPLVNGRVTPVEALVIFAALSSVGIGLVITLNTFTQFLAVFAALLTIVYPFTKRFFAAPQLILGCAFGWSIPMAFAAQTGEVPRLAWLMFLSVVIHAIIYDTMYAMVDREYDRKAGMKSTAILFGPADVFLISVLQIILLLALVLIGEVAQLGIWYLLSLPVVALLMLYERGLIKERDPDKCLRAFLNNHYIGAAVFVGIALDYIFSAPIIGT